MVSDQEPRYRLVDDEGNIVGSLYGKADGSVAIQETDSGSDREVALAPDGTFSAPSVETESVSTENAVIDSFSRRDGSTEITGDILGKFDEEREPLDASIAVDTTTYAAARIYYYIRRGDNANGLFLRLNGQDGSDYVAYELSDQGISKTTNTEWRLAELGDRAYVGQFIVTMKATGTPRAQISRDFATTNARNNDSVLLNGSEAVGGTLFEDVVSIDLFTKQEDVQIEGYVEGLTRWSG